MNVDFVRLGAKNKYSMLLEFLKEYKLDESEVGYFGDDVIDADVLKFVTYSYAPRCLRVRQKHCKNRCKCQGWCGRIERNYR